MTPKPKKRIALVDAGEKAEILRAVIPFVADRYDLEITQDRDADYVFHSCFGNDKTRVIFADYFIFDC